LGINALILASIIPNIELIIGKQKFSTVEGASATEMQNVLMRYFVILMGVLSGKFLSENMLKCRPNVWISKETVNSIFG
jgi:hypothetical protein